MKRPLQELLSKELTTQDEDTDEQMDVDTQSVAESEVEEDPTMCVECGDQRLELKCVDCDEQFCQVCFEYLHRTGKRKQHTTVADPNAPKQPEQKSNEVKPTTVEEDDDEEDMEQPRERIIANVANSLIANQGKGNHDESVLLKKIADHARFIPMRLTGQERKLLRLLEAALNVSEYTDKVDILLFKSKAKRMIAQLKEMCSILSGLVVATNMADGQALIQDKDFAQNAEWFQTVFELGRRYKIMNPEKMRDTFGKLMYMIMDSRLPEVKDAMDFDLYKPVKTVHLILEQKSAQRLLSDPLVLQATAEIVPEKKNRMQIQREIRTKERAIEQLARNHKSAQIDSEEIRQCLYSIGDYHAYLRANCYPVEQMLKMLEENFSPDGPEPGYALGISYGIRGARLSHSHTKQYHYVKQSLTLWSQIMRDMFMMWYLADSDLCAEKHRYQLRDTGQGLNRVKDCPFVGRAMHGIIRIAQERTGKWIGSSVVHLGDHNVPNALMFLDKYLQVPRILTPVFSTIQKLDGLARDPYALQWIEQQHDSLDELKKQIMVDFFRHAFDGSGADNGFDAGSCVDGRLTSAWNWANEIHKKPYYNKFLVTGFVGFDGSDGF